MNLAQHMSCDENSQGAKPCECYHLYTLKACLHTDACQCWDIRGRTVKVASGLGVR